jgi:LAO/AO transport system kinase
MLAPDGEPVTEEGDPAVEARTADVPPRPRPKHPKVLLASGLTAAGVPELLAALDEHHGRRAAAADPHAPRLARARAQVEGILSDRVRDALWSAERRAATEEVVARVAAHEVDPYSAADRLLEEIAARA